MESSTHDGGDNGDGVVVVRNHQTKMQLPTLESLEFDKIKKDHTDIFLEFLRTLGPVFKSKLKRLEMYRCKIDENRLKILMLEIVPKFEGLVALILHNNEIESIENLVDSIEHDSHYSISKSIRHLDLTNSPIVLSTNSPKKTKSILSLLKIYKNLHNLGSAFDENHMDRDD